MGNKLNKAKTTRKRTNSAKSNKKYNASIIKKLLKLNIATRDEIKNAMDNVSNPNDVNQVAAYLIAQNESKAKTKDNNENKSDNDTDDAVYIMSEGVLYKINRADYNRLMQQQQQPQIPETERKQQEQKIKEQQTERKQKEDEENAEYTAIISKHEAQNELLVHGYLHKNFKCSNTDSMSKILQICLEFYHISYLRLMSLAGNEFINNKSEKLTFNQCIKGYDLIAFYFSAKWCPPSLEFTAKMKKLFMTAVNKNIKLQIIFVSLDRSERNMMEYFRENHGNYMAIPYENEDRKNLLGQVFGCEYIPHLCVVNNGCNLLDRYGRKTVTDNGENFMEIINIWQDRNMKICKEIEIIAKEKRIEEEIENRLIKDDENRDLLIINGYIHVQCDILAFEWIMPVGIFNVCFDFYHISYKKLLKLCGNKFIRQNGKKCGFTDGVKGYDMIGFYFSAIWCPPSKAFTPKLKELYEIANKEKKKLQIIFISSDQSEDAMMNYFKGYHGDYLALEFDDKMRKDLLGKVFQCKYIPHLCIVNDKCEMLDAAATNTVMKYKEDAIEMWERGKDVEQIVCDEVNDVNDEEEK